MRSNSGIAVLIPSYNRPEILKITLPSWLKANLDEVFVLAEASSKDTLKKYDEILKRYNRNGRIVYKLIPKRLGSIRARNTLLEMASKQGCKYVVMADDDYLLPDKNSLVRMAKKLNSSDEIGAIGGKVITSRRRVDPDFFLNLPINLADLLSRLVGYVFLDIKHGPRFSEFLPPFFMIKRDILSKIRYDENFNTPTGFREESDFQLQIKRLGYKLLYDPRIYVIHLATESGGNRPKIDMGERMYWKARNHTIFILKWNKSIPKRIWCIVFSVLILSLYRIWHVSWIFKGIKDGMRNSFKSYSKNLECFQ
jgi:GT2 family glycosyltransferase